MRLLFIPSWFPSENNPYAGSFIKRLALDLSEAGIEIIVLHFDYNYKTIKQNISSHKINKNLTVHRYLGFQLPKINQSTQNAWVKKCLSVCKKEIANTTFNLVHSHDYIGSFVGYALSIQLNIPHLISLHHSDFIERKIPRWRIEKLTAIFNKAASIIVPSQALKESIKIDYLINCKLIPHYIYWGLHPKEKVKKPLKAITVTSHEKVKNNFGLIEYCKLNNISIDIYGTVEKSIKAQQTDSIKCKGKVVFTELQKIYHLYDFYISFSHIETFGLTILEALSHGLPVLVKNVSGSRDMVNPDNGMIIDSENSYQEFIENYSNYNTQNISSQVQNTFSKELILKKYLEIFKRENQ